MLNQGKEIRNLNDLGKDVYLKFHFSRNDKVWSATQNEVLYFMPLRNAVFYLVEIQKFFKKYPILNLLLLKRNIATISS